MNRTEPPPVSILLPLLRDALAREGRIQFPLRGDSMLPTLPLECEIEVVPLPDELRVGDLVVFALQETLVAHRLVRGGVQPVAHGDNRRVADPPLLPEQVLGRVARAFVDGEQVWPGLLEPLKARGWTARHYVLNAGRRIVLRLRNR